MCSFPSSLLYLLFGKEFINFWKSFSQQVVFLYFHRETERANPFFTLQKRKGHGGGGGFASLLLGTLDNVLDNKVKCTYQKFSTTILMRIYLFWINVDMASLLIMYGVNSFLIIMGCPSMGWGHLFEKGYLFEKGHLFE